MDKLVDHDPNEVRKLRMSFVSPTNFQLTHSNFSSLSTSSTLVTDRKTPIEVFADLQNKLYINSTNNMIMKAQRNAYYYQFGRFLQKLQDQKSYRQELKSRNAPDMVDRTFKYAERILKLYEIFNDYVFFYPGIFHSYLLCEISDPVFHDIYNTMKTNSNKILELFNTTDN